MDIHTIIDSPLGEILLVGDGTGRLTRVSFDVGAPPPGRRDPAAFGTAARQFEEYFAGGRTAFDLPLAAHGTAFQQRVWAEVAALPYGSTTSYGELTARAGATRDRVRAVGAAIGANPLLVVVPCHRVVGASGALTGYAGGLDRKRDLLTLEGALQPQLWSVLS
ncbi:methylated-DNA--[protein]-cysteine S-methyltransferase [Nonomuraea spiralis]|uniref:Methylated-DNA--protein-cysteine methyltransferase n=1 Tax=Nonomuraea spiralis TaxID=46182 RepID=A0ABV5II71_9ACTN|nr:methylated-DNA--[protein]-cysteine S-methyltransferase [Nonomuraea spiralis]GGS96473.1 methylated-DNA--protein-cysteine methyltransferase [Nonomuraea spiralis]